METRMKLETKLSLAVTYSAAAISSPFILQLTEELHQLVYPAVGFTAIFLLLRIFSKKWVAGLYVKNTTYRILSIKEDSNDPPRQARQGSRTVFINVIDTATGRIKGIRTYEELTQGFQIGQEIGLVKRPARHTYEIDRWYLIPVEVFDVEREREKYMKGVEMDHTSYTGWTDQNGKGDLKVVKLEIAIKDLKKMKDRYSSLKLEVSGRLIDDDIEKARDEIEQLSGLKKAIEQMERLNVQVYSGKGGSRA